MPTTEAQQDAQSFIKAALADGPRLAVDVQTEAKAAGYTPAQVRTARGHLGVEIDRSGDGRSRWALPSVAAGDSLAARAADWVDDRVAIGQLSDIEVQTARWLIGVLGDGARRRDEVESLSAERYIDENVLSAVVRRMVVRQGEHIGMRSAETWQLAALPGLSAHERLAIQFSRATRAGWDSNPRSARWLPDGPAWLAKLGAEHGAAVAALEQAERALADTVAHAVDQIAFRGFDRLDPENAAHVALTEQVAEPRQTAVERERLVRELAEARRAGEDLVRRQEEEERNTTLRAARMQRGVGLPEGWEPGDPVMLPEVDRIAHHDARQAAADAVRQAEAELLAATRHVERRAHGLLIEIPTNQKERIHGQ